MQNCVAGATKFGIERCGLFIAESKGADDLWFVALPGLVDDAEAIIVTQGDAQLGQLFVGNAGAKLAIERIGGGLAEREAVVFLDGLGEWRRVEQRAFDLIGVALQPFVGAKTRAGRKTGLSADGLFLGHDELNASFDERVKTFLSRQRGRVRQTLGRFQDFKLRLRDVATVPAHPGQHVVPLPLIPLKRLRPAWAG